VTAVLEESLRWERRARQLLQAVAVADATTTESALQTVIDAVCQCTGWPVGHALLRNSAGELVSSGVWHLADPGRFGTFRTVSAKAVFARGVGLPGRVLASARPLWIMDVGQDENFPRAREAQGLAVRAAFGFPAIVQGEVVAVLEFFSPDEREPDEPLLDVMRSIGSELAHTMERLSVAAALRRSEVRFRSVAQTAHDGIITAGADGKIVSWNQGAERMFGWTEAEALGMELQTIIPERFRRSHAEGMARVRAGGPHRVIGRTLQLDGLRRDGSEFPLELTLATWQIEDERFYTGIVRDVTERKQAEENLRRAAERLQAWQAVAVEANRAKTIFLANMSHELRTPLNAILGFVQLMARDGNLSDAQRENLSIIMRSGEHLLGLINDVLSISKIEAGESELHPRAFGLLRLLDSLREMFQLRARTRGLHFSIEPPASVPARVYGDEGKLRQVLINILGNAIKFTKEGSVVLRVTYHGERAAFEVRDTGPGISRTDQERLFQPFVQVEAGISANEGTGLGLAICRDHVRLMGGALTLRSALQKGTRFFFEIPLPAADKEKSARRPGRVVAIAPGEPRWRLLVVDNAADNRLLLSRLLASVGFEVSEAADGAQGLAEWSRYSPHFVWMDMRMPVMNGYEATRRIRAEEASGADGTRTVIVALTASAFEHDRASILAAGCDEIVAKPFTEETIFDTIARRLGVRFLRDAEPPTSTPSDAFSRARLGALPEGMRRELLEALSAGDDLAAQRAIDRFPRADGVLVAELRQMLKDLRLDELLGLLEEVTR
jgi:two-component system sensor histidine kinase/response regulator